jgi:hypothetical protein
VDHHPVFNAIYVERERTATEDPLEPLSMRWSTATRSSCFPKAPAAMPRSRSPSRPACTTWPAFPQVVLVPAWINNVQRVMPKGEVVPVPVLCSVTFGAPMRWRTARSASAFLDRARKLVDLR